MIENYPMAWHTHARFLPAYHNILKLWLSSPSMKKLAAVSLIMVLSAGMLLSHPAFAHDFVQNSDADTIAKVQQFKAETRLVADNISNSTLSQWHISKSQGYWGTNEMGILDQKDPVLAGKISTAVDDLYSMASQPNPSLTLAGQKADELGSLADQAESEMVPDSSRNNATVQALAMVDVLNEVLKDYGNAIGSTVDLTNMDNMNMSSSVNAQGMSGMSMPGTPIANMAAYQSAKELGGVAQTMFASLQSAAPSSASPYLGKVGTALGELDQKIGSQASGMDVMTVVHLQIHPNLISAFNIEAVPEFPIPTILVAASFTGLIVLTRVFYRR